MKSTHLILFLLLTQIITAQTFTEITDTPIDGIGSGSIAISDINSDGHDDVLIAGLSNLGEFFTKLFINDGTGSFTEMVDTPFDDTADGSVAFSDINSDGHEDVLLH
jgi:hypothetical protein